MEFEWTKLIELQKSIVIIISSVAGTNEDAFAPSYPSLPVEVA
jgi:hypothetical protein